MVLFKHVNAQKLGDALTTPFMTISSRKLIKAAWSDGQLDNFAKYLAKYRWQGTRDYTMALIMLSIIVAAGKDSNLEEIRKGISSSDLMKLFGKIGSGNGVNLRTFLDGDQGKWFKKLFEGLLDKLPEGENVNKETLWANFITQVSKMTPWKLNKSYIEGSFCEALSKAFGTQYTKKVEEKLSKLPNQNELELKLEPIPKPEPKPTQPAPKPRAVSPDVPSKSDHDDTDYSDLSELFSEEQPKPELKPQNVSVPTPIHVDKSAENNWTMFFDLNETYEKINESGIRGEGVRQNQYTLKAFRLTPNDDYVLNTLVHSDYYCFVGYKKNGDNEFNILILPTKRSIEESKKQFRFGAATKTVTWTHTDEDIIKIKNRLLNSQRLGFERDELTGVGITPDWLFRSVKTIPDYIKDLESCVKNNPSKKSTNGVKADPQKVQEAYDEFMKAGSAEEFMKAFDKIFSDDKISSMQDLMSYSESLLKSIYDQSVKHGVDPYNARIDLKKLDNDLKYIHGEFIVSNYVALFRSRVNQYIGDVFQISESEARGDEAATFVPIDEKIRSRALKKYYGKTIKYGEELTLYFNGEKRVWIPEGDKSATKTGLKPLNNKEKLQLALNGARGEDRNTIIYLMQRCLDENYKVPEDEEQFINDLIAKSKTKAIAIDSLIKDIEHMYIFNGRPDEARRDSVEMDTGTHGIAHATRLVSYIDDIAKFIRKHYAELKLKSPTKDEIILAKYAALFHDSGRANKMIDIFDETSAHIAAEELKDTLSKENIKRVQDAIKNKDVFVEGKDIVAVMLHEADVFDIIRIYGKSKFDFRYLDVVQSYFGKKQSEINDDELKKFPPEANKGLAALTGHCSKCIQKLKTLSKSDILDDED